MMEHRRIKQEGAIIVLSLILMLWLVFPCHAEEGEKAIFESNPVSFSLALSRQSDASIATLFPVTNTQYNPGQKNFAPILQVKPGKSAALGNSLFTASLLTLTALNIADYVSTVKALQLPGMEEGNPMMRPFANNLLLLGTVKLGIAALDFYLLKNIYKKNKALGWVLSIAANVAVSYVVSHNMRKIQSFSGK